MMHTTGQLLAIGAILVFVLLATMPLFFNHD